MPLRSNLEVIIYMIMVKKFYIIFQIYKNL